MLLERGRQGILTHNSTNIPQRERIQVLLKTSNSQLHLIYKDSFLSTIASKDILTACPKKGVAAYHLQKPRRLSVLFPHVTSVKELQAAVHTTSTVRKW